MMKPWIPVRTAVIGLSLILAAIAAAPGCGRSAEEADLVLLNGKIVTLDPDRGEVRALAATGGRIVALGDDGDVRRFIGHGTDVIDLDGRLAVPGFIDSHGHLESLGRAMLGLDLTGASTWEEIVDMVAVASGQTEPGAWIVGRGWHQEKWSRPPQGGVEGFPIHAALNRVSPDNPVLLVHASGHASIANARALEAAGVDRSTPDPPGGRFVRYRSGELTGVMQETAENAVADALAAYEYQRTPAEIEAAADKAIELAVKECLSRGVTGFQDAGSPYATVDRYRRLADEGRLGIRVWVMLSEDNDALARRMDEYRVDGAFDHHLTVRGIKRLVDGALGSRGAWLLEPYSDQPDTAGLNTIDLEELEETARLAAEHGFQLCVHAIGDRGNREVLNIYQDVLGKRADGRDLRWRIEHAQHLHPDDVPRFSELGVIASMQGIHCTSDGPWVPQRVGEKRSAEGAYVWRKLLDSGAVVSNGTDTPVESVDPLDNFHALVTRQMPGGERFHPEQAMTREEALRAYTLDSAYAAFGEEQVGSLSPGKMADVAVLSRDILTVPEGDIPGTEVVYTIVGGKVLHRLAAGD